MRGRLYILNKEFKRIDPPNSHSLDKQLWDLEEIKRIVNQIGTLLDIVPLNVESGRLIGPYIKHSNFNPLILRKTQRIPMLVAIHLVFNPLSGSDSKLLGFYPLLILESKKPDEFKRDKENDAPSNQSQKATDNK